MGGTALHTKSPLHIKSGGCTQSPGRFSVLREAYHSGMNEIDKFEAVLRELMIPYIREESQVSLGRTKEPVILDFNPEDGKFAHLRINEAIWERAYGFDESPA